MAILLAILNKPVQMNVLSRSDRRHVFLSPRRCDSASAAEGARRRSSWAVEVRASEERRGEGPTAKERKEIARRAAAARWRRKGGRETKLP